MINHNKFTSPTIPLLQKALTLARQFAKEQATPPQGKRVYLNTLAVYAVHTHLKRLNIVTDLNQSDSWNPELRALFQPADLLLPGIGKLECCPVLPGKTQMALPGMTEDRLGYVAVQFSDRLDQVQLLGFVTAADIPEAATDWAITQLQPFSQLLDWLPESTPSSEDALVNLGNWFSHHLTTGWQTLEDLLDTETVQFAFDFRGLPAVPIKPIPTTQGTTVSACKVIDFAKHFPLPSPTEGRRSQVVTSDVAETLVGPRLVLLISLSSTAEAVDIVVRVCPMDQQIYLPADLQLVVWDQAGALMQADTRQVNNWIQLEFSGQPGERFNLKMALGEVSITEEFLI